MTKRPLAARPTIDEVKRWLADIPGFEAPDVEGTASMPSLSAPQSADPNVTGNDAGKQPAKNAFRVGGKRYSGQHYLDDASFFCGWGGVGR